MSTSSAWTPRARGSPSSAARSCRSARGPGRGSPSPSTVLARVTTSSPTRSPTAGRTGSRAHWHGCATPPRTRPRPQVPDAARLLDLLAPAGLTPDDVAGRWRVSRAPPRPCSASPRPDPAPSTCAATARTPWSAGRPARASPSCCRRSIASLALGNRPDEMVVRAGRLQGRLGVQGLRAAAAHRRPRHRPRRPPHRAGPGLARGRAAAAASTCSPHVGAKDIEDYQASRRRCRRRLPRLVLVIDEFKALAEELPDFLDGLVRIAAVGRSLGIHLVLATQRPGGIVSADIKANVNLRIALRVRDTVDSDRRHRRPGGAGHPGTHPRPGLRAFRRPAPRALPDRPGRRTGRTSSEVSDVSASRWSWDTAGDPPPRRPARSAPSAARPTWPAVVEATTQAATHRGHRAPLFPVAPATAGPRALPTRLLADPWQVPYALADLPRQQAQRPVTWDLENDGHLAVAGASRTGRTSFLRTLAGTLAARLSPDGRPPLRVRRRRRRRCSALTGLPHTGSVVTRDEAARATGSSAGCWRRSVRRQRLWREHGFGSLAEQRRAALGPASRRRQRCTTGAALPYLVAPASTAGRRSCPGWEARDHGRTLDACCGCCARDRPSAIRAVVTGDRSVLLSRVGLGGVGEAGPADGRRDGPADGGHRLRRRSRPSACRAGPARGRLGRDAARPPRWWRWKRRPERRPWRRSHAPVRQRVPPSVATSPGAPGRRSAWTPCPRG